LSSVLFNSARFVGPMVAGLILSVSDLGKTFLFNAFSYLAMITALLYMKPLPRRATVSRHSVLHDLGQGIRYGAGHASIGPLLLMIGVVAIFARPIADLLPGFADHVFGRGEQGLVWLTSAMGAGSIIGGMWLAQRASVTGLPAITLTSIVVTGLSLVAFAATNQFVLALVLIVVASGAISVCGTATQTLVQRIVDEDKRGRVMSLWGLIFRGAPALGVLMMGTLSERFGLAAPVIGGAVVCVVFAAYGLRWRLPLDAEVALQAATPG
jgi:predicted MFS family arabinose efflux permease